MILVDTPGIFQPKRRLDRAMFASAWDRAGDADIVRSGDRRSAWARSDRSTPLFKHLPEVRRPIVAVLNKIDQVAKPDLLRLATELSAIRAFDRVFMLSALTGDGVGDLKAYLAAGRAAWDLGSFPRTSSPTPRSGRARRRSPARSCSSGCMTSCLIR